LVIALLCINGVFGTTINGKRMMSVQFLTGSSEAMPLGAPRVSRRHVASVSRVPGAEVHRFACSSLDGPYCGLTSLSAQKSPIDLTAISNVYDVYNAFDICGQLKL
jgi:hypothetical protein